MYKKQIYIKGLSNETYARVSTEIRPEIYSGPYPHTIVRSTYILDLQFQSLQTAKLSTTRPSIQTARGSSKAFGKLFVTKKFPFVNITYLKDDFK